MGIQSKINSALASTTGAIYGIKAKLKDRQTEAMKRVDEVKEAQKNQRRNFMDYLSKLPTNYGVNVGSLSPDVQKKIENAKAELIQIEEKIKVIDSQF